MAAPEQVNGHSTIDVSGRTLASGIWVPASSVLGMRMPYGVDEQTDSGGSHYVAWAVAPHAPLTPAAGVASYASGTSGGQTLNMTPAPAAGVMQYVRGVLISAQVAPAAQAFTCHLGGLTANGPNGSIDFEAKTTDAVQFLWTFPDPIPASAAATQIFLATTPAAATTYRIDVQLWGFNRAV